MKFIITYGDYKTKSAKSANIRANTYEELLNKTKELLGDYGELISIIRVYPSE